MLIVCLDEVDVKKSMLVEYFTDIAVSLSSTLFSSEESYFCSRSNFERIYSWNIQTKDQVALFPVMVLLNDFICKIKHQITVRLVP